MSKLDDVTLGDIGRGIVRYRPYIALVLAIALIIGFMPGDRGDSGVTTTDFAGGDFEEGDVGFDGGNEGSVGDGQAGGGAGFGEGGGGLTGGQLAAGGGGGGGRVRGTSGGGSSGGGTGGGTGGGGGGGSSGPAMVANCDPETGRIAIPSLRAPYCVPAASGNTGNDYRGVTADTIKIAIYRVRQDAATQAVLAAAGANDSEEDTRKQYAEWIEFYETHYEQYGRKIEYFFIPASGKSTDTAAANADAQIAIDSGAFASIEAANNTYVDKVTEHGLMCFCTVSQPIENYLAWKPLVWSTLMASSQGYIHRAEYVGKRLARRNAMWSGEPRFQNAERVFGLVYYDTDDKAYKAGADFFERHLREKYGVRLKVKLEYHGYPEVQRSQVEAGPLIQRLKDEGVSSIICACDPFGPTFFTKEATRQLYFPEWIITGSALTDTSFFARTYDPDQWKHAFGISFLTARVPEPLDESFRLLHWHFGRGPSAEAGYGVIRSPLEIFFMGVHMAGPTLNPGTFRDGLFRMPALGHGHVTVETISYGRKGIWPWDDFLAYDDVTEIWWDPDAEGPDELDQNGEGLYRYVDGGKRYLPTQHPTSDPKAFDRAGTVTIYSEPPPGDRWKDYPPPR